MFGRISVLSDCSYVCVMLLCCCRLVKVSWLLVGLVSMLCVCGWIGLFCCWFLVNWG